MLSKQIKKRRYFNKNYFKVRVYSLISDKTILQVNILQASNTYFFFVCLVLKYVNCRRKFFNNFFYMVETETTSHAYNINDATIFNTKLKHGEYYYRNSVNFVGKSFSFVIFFFLFLVLFDVVVVCMYVCIVSKFFLQVQFSVDFSYINSS